MKARLHPGIRERAPRPIYTLPATSRGRGVGVNKRGVLLKGARMPLTHGCAAPPAPTPVAVTGPSGRGGGRRAYAAPPKTFEYF